MTEQPKLHPTLLCRTHLHHKWVPAHTEDGGRYMRCEHCGTEKVFEPGQGDGTTLVVAWVA